MYRHLIALAIAAALFACCGGATPEEGSASRAALLTGQHCHSNGMLGLAHRGWSLHDYGTLWVHALRPAGYRSTLIGEQHLSVDPGVLGYDEVVDVPSNHASEVTPRAVEAIASLPEPWFLSVGFFETHRSFAAPTSVRDTLYSLPPAHLPDTPAVRDWAERHARSPGERAREAEARYINIVFVVEGGIARARPVETGLSDERRIEIRSGLQPADRVVVGPFRVLDELKDGQAVQEVKATSEAGYRHP